MTTTSNRRRFGARLALGLWAAVPLGLPLLAHAAGETAKPAPTAPDEALLAGLDARAAVFKDKVAAADIESVVEGVQRMSDALQKGDIAAARKAWIEARVGWERSEIFTADLFPDFDKFIDTWPDATTGFHAIEVKLFASEASAPVAEAQALLDKLQSYRRVFGQAKFTGYYLIAGMATLAYEMGESKSKGGESTASGTSLNDLQHNLEGLDRAWRFLFAEALSARNPALAKRIDGQLAALKSSLAISTLDNLEPGAFEKGSELLAGSLADASVALGWRAPSFSDAGE
jgi:iron uptake system component EfeO